MPTLRSPIPTIRAAAERRFGKYRVLVLTRVVQWPARALVRAGIGRIRRDPRLVAFGDAPAPMHDGVVEQIRGREDQNGLIAMPADARFAPGEAVQVKSGPLQSCMGLFDGITDNQRVAVLLDILGRKTRVMLNLSSVAAA